MHVHQQQLRCASVPQKWTNRGRWSTLINNITWVFRVIPIKETWQKDVQGKERSQRRLSDALDNISLELKPMCGSNFDDKKADQSSFTPLRLTGLQQPHYLFKGKQF